MQATVVFNLYEFRTGVWLARAYLTGVDAGGRPRTVHTAASVASLAGYGLEADAGLSEVVRLTDQLREKAVAEHFRRGARKVPTLAGLVTGKSRERNAVLDYVHLHLTRLLELCRERNYFLTANLDPRSSPLPHLLQFADRSLTPELHFAFGEGGIRYRLLLRGRGKKALTVRSLDPRILTNGAENGWVLAGSVLHRLSGMKGEGLRPFLSRDALDIPPPQAAKYLREFVAPALRRHKVHATGVVFEAYTDLTEIRLAARPHPFNGAYLLYLTFGYGPLVFPFGSPERQGSRVSTRPPFRLEKAVRDNEAEAAALRRLTSLGPEVMEGNEALTLPEAGPYGNLRWLLENGRRLTDAGWTVDTPVYEGQAFTNEAGSLELTAQRDGDWLDLRADVRVGDRILPFASLVRHLQRGERIFSLPDGGCFLIPEAWFSTYGPGLQMAQVREHRVRMARSQAPLLARAAVALPPGPNETDQIAAELPTTLRATLRPYQEAGVRWLIDHYHAHLGACLADDMGLGKTLQTIAVLLYAKERAGATDKVAPPQMDLFQPLADDHDFIRPLRALVVVPASLVYNWARELRKFAPTLSVLANVGNRRVRESRVLARHDVILTTYQTALRDQPVLADVGLTYVVLDESQQIKNRQSKAFRALTALEVPHRISLSGTPIENSLSDLWSQMQFINPGLLGTYPFFKKTFIGPIEGHDDELRKQQLRELVHPYLLRRTKADVAPDLPDLDLQLCYCEMTKAQARLYESERAAARNALLGAGAADGEGSYKLLVIQALTRLRQLANHPVIVEETYRGDSGKWGEVLEQWDTIRRAGHKVLIFSSMVSYLELFRAEIERQGHAYAWLTGALTARERAREVDRFQTEAAVQTFFISIKAGGTGLNLTAADYVFILDPWWNPTTEEQAIARAHRIGRSGKVIARKFITRGTLEEKIYRLQQRKRQLAEDIIGKGEHLELDRGEIAYLLGTEE